VRKTRARWLLAGLLVLDVLLFLVFAAAAGDADAASSISHALGAVAGLR